MILQFDPSIRARKTERLSVLFGNVQYDKPKLFSYSLFENDMITEVRFEDKQVLRHLFDGDGFLTAIETYNVDHELIQKYKFESVEKLENEISFKAGKAGEKFLNPGRLKVSPSENKGTLRFKNAYSILGYWSHFDFTYDEMGLITEERFWQHNKDVNADVLAFAYLNQYEIRENELELTARAVLSNGWKALN